MRGQDDDHFPLPVIPDLRSKEHANEWQVAQEGNLVHGQCVLFRNQTPDDQRCVVRDPPVRLHATRGYSRGRSQNEVGIVGVQEFQVAPRDPGRYNRVNQHADFPAGLVDPRANIEQDSYRQVLEVEADLATEVALQAARNRDVFSHADRGLSVVERHDAGSGENLGLARANQCAKGNVPVPVHFGLKEIAEVRSLRKIEKQCVPLGPRILGTGGQTEVDRIPHQVPLDPQIAQALFADLQDHGVDEDLAGGTVDEVVQNAAHLAELLGVGGMKQHEQLVRRRGNRVVRHLRGDSRRQRKLAP